MCVLSARMTYAYPSYRRLVLVVTAVGTECPPVSAVIASKFNPQLFHCDLLRNLIRLAESPDLLLRLTGSQKADKRQEE